MKSYEFSHYNKINSTNQATDPPLRSAGLEIYYILTAKTETLLRCLNQYAITICFNIKCTTN